MGESKNITPTIEQVDQAYATLQQALACKGNKALQDKAATGLSTFIADFLSSYSDTAEDALVGLDLLMRETVEKLAQKTVAKGPDAIIAEVEQVVNRLNKKSPGTGDRILAEAVLGALKKTRSQLGDILKV